MGLYKRGDVYWMDRSIEGRRYREPLDTGNYQDARDREDARVAEIRKQVEVPSGEAVSKGSFRDAAAAYIRAQRGQVAESTIDTEGQLLKALNGFFGDMRLRRINAGHVRAYREERLNAVGESTINQEVALLRRVMKRSRREVAIKPLRVEIKVGRALEPEQKARLFELAASNPNWRRAFLAARLAAATTLRRSELQRLTWEEVDERTEIITVLKSKTKKGVRVIPINDAAHAALDQLRGEHPVRVVPFRSWRSAWKALTVAAGLPGLRFHDLRHHAITELAESGASDQTILDLAGHVDRKMLEHYSHIRIAAKRKAMAALNG